MALINCPECKHAISDKATACPQCGYPMKEDKNDNTEAEPSFQEQLEANEKKTHLHCPACLSTFITRDTNNQVQGGIVLNNQVPGTDFVLLSSPNNNSKLQCVSCKTRFTTPLSMNGTQKKKLNKLCLDTLQRTGSAAQTLAALRQVHPGLLTHAKFHYILNIAHANGLNTKGIEREKTLREVYIVLGFVAFFATMIGLVYAFG